MDAAATLVMLNAALELEISRDALAEAAIPLGGDVPACVLGVPVLMRGDGDQVQSYAPPLPVLNAVLIRPNVACPTGPVFRAFDQNTVRAPFEETPPPIAESFEEFCSDLNARYRNDLEAPAINLKPEISEVLNALKGGAPSFASMSGSGATCFALFPDEAHCIQTKELMRSAFPSAWVKSTKLGSAGFDASGFTL